MDLLNLKFDNEKSYLVKGETLNKLVEAINERTPLPQSPLTAEDKPGKGVEIKFGGGSETEYHVVINGTLYTHVFVTVGDPVEVE